MVQLYSSIIFSDFFPLLLSFLLFNFPLPYFEHYWATCVALSVINLKFNFRKKLTFSNGNFATRLGKHKKHRNRVRLIGYQQLHKNTCSVLQRNFPGNWKWARKRTQNQIRGVSKVTECAWLNWKHAILIKRFCHMKIGLKSKLKL